jgi:hypothetical protein
MDHGLARLRLRLLWRRDMGTRAVSTARRAVEDPTNKGSGSDGAGKD